MADNRPVWEFSLPSSGTEIKWRPLTAGQELSIATTYRRPEELPLQGPMLTVARVVKFGAAERMTLADYQNLETLDVQAFEDEIIIREGERRAALRKADPARTSPAALADEAVKDAVKAFGHAIDMLAKANELVQVAARGIGDGPLPK